MASTRSFRLAKSSGTPTTPGKDTATTCFVSVSSTTAGMPQPRRASFMAASVNAPLPMRSSAARVSRRVSGSSRSRSRPSSSSTRSRPSPWAVVRFISCCKLASASATPSSATPSLCNSPHWNEPSQRYTPSGSSRSLKCCPWFIAVPPRRASPAPAAGRAPPSRRSPVPEFDSSPRRPRQKFSARSAPAARPAPAGSRQTRPAAPP